MWDRLVIRVCPKLAIWPYQKKYWRKELKIWFVSSDGRMSGTAYGTTILHVSPESAIGGNLALVQNGDMIELDVEQRKIHLDVSDEELEKRRAKWTPPKPAADRGYVNHYVKHVMAQIKAPILIFYREVQDR